MTNNNKKTKNLLAEGFWKQTSFKKVLLRTNNLFYNSLYYQNFEKIINT